MAKVQQVAWAAKHKDISDALNLVLENEMIYSAQEIANIAEQAYQTVYGSSTPDSYHTAVAFFEFQQ